MPIFAAIEDTIYAWMPRWFLIMMLVSSVGSALLFVLTIRVSGRKGFLFLALAAAIPAILFTKAIIEQKIEEAQIRRQFGEVSFSYQGGPSPEIPWMSVLTLIGAIMIYRSEKKRANQMPEPTSGLKPGRGSS